MNTSLNESFKFASQKVKNEQEKSEKSPFTEAQIKANSKVVTYSKLNPDDTLNGGISPDMSPKGSIDSQENDDD